MKVRKGDKVKVTTGKHRGTIATVLAVNPKENTVVVEGVNVKKRAVKQTENSSENFIYIQKPINASNVRLVDADGKYVKNREALPKVEAKAEPKAEAKPKTAKKTTKTEEKGEKKSKSKAK